MKTWTIPFPPSKLGRLLLALSLLQGLIVICIEAYIGAVVIPNINITDLTDSNRGLPVYFFIFVFSQAWTVFLAWDAILKQNTIQLISFIMFNLCTFAYSLFQLKQLAYGARSLPQIVPYLISIPCILGAFTLSFVFMNYKLYLEFGWNIYKKIGADPNMKHMFRLYQVFLTLLKVGFFFWISFSLQYLVLVLEINDIEFIFTILAIPITILALFLAVYGLRRENKKIMLVFFFGLLVGFVYFIFKIVRIWTSGRNRLANTQHFLTFFASLSVFTLAITGINSIFCYRNFGKGLKEHVVGDSKNSPKNTRSQSRGSAH